MYRNNDFDGIPEDALRLEFSKVAGSDDDDSVGKRLRFRVGTWGKTHRNTQYQRGGKRKEG